MAKTGAVKQFVKKVVTTRAQLPALDETGRAIKSGAKRAAGGAVATTKTAATRKAGPSYSQAVNGKPGKTKPVYSKAAQAQNKAITKARLKVGGTAAGVGAAGAGGVVVAKKRKKAKAK